MLCHALCSSDDKYNASTFNVYYNLDPDGERRATIRLTLGVRTTQINIFFPSVRSIKEDVWNKHLIEGASSDSDANYLAWLHDT